jgi:hypothetical protein
VNNNNGSPAKVNNELDDSTEDEFESKYQFIGLDHFLKITKGSTC